MARARNIKPGFFVNEALAETGPTGQLLFAGLWTLADRDGRLEDRPKRIGAQIFPYYDANIDKLLNELENRRFIQRYAVDGQRYIQITNFEKHQNPHCKEKESTIPAPDEHGAHSVQASEFIERAALIPDPGFLIPDSRIPDSPIPTPTSLAQGPAKKPRSPRASKGEGSSTSQTWTAYSDAYYQRYGTEPVRNARINGQLARLIERLGADEAPAVAAFYLRHNGKFYVQKMHPVGLLLADAEKLRTEWAVNRTVTETEARQADRRQATGNVFGTLIAEVKDGTHG